MNTLKEKIIAYYTDKKNWKTIPPTFEKVGKHFGVVRSYVHRIIKDHEKHNI